MKKKIPVWRCKCCDTYSVGSEFIDNVVDPNPLPDTVPETWAVCTECRTVEGFDPICDMYPECTGNVSAGLPTANGWRSVCYIHSKEIRESQYAGENKR